MPKIFVAVLLISMPSRLNAQIAGATLHEITVRTYKPSISEADFRTARRLAGEILGQAGLSLSWLQCWSADPAAKIPAECAEPRLPNALVLRVMHAPRVTIGPAVDERSPNHQASLGDSYVDLHAASGSLATVYSDRVRALSRGTGVDSVALLARAIAHEIGHLLLGTNRHAASGLMRAAWSRAEVRRDMAADWRFSDAEGKAMRKAVETLHGRSIPSQ